MTGSRHARPGPEGKAASEPPTPGAAAAPDPASLFAVVRGDPSAEQVAALVAVLAARTAAAAGASRPGHRRSQWSARSRLLRAPLPGGPGGWRASARPR